MIESIAKLAAMGSRLSLRARLLLGMLAVAFTAATGFAVAMHQFVEALENELLYRTLHREMDGIVMDYRDGTRIEGKRGGSGEVFVVPSGGSTERLPRGLTDVDSDQYREFEFQDREYFATRRDVAGARIYFVLDMESVETLEERLEMIGWLTLAATIVIAFIVAVLFAYLILRPVRGLAARLATTNPGQTNAPIAPDYADRDMRQIAASFDGLIERFHAFIDRERSFTEDASHELRTPLAVALSANELLLQQDDLSAQARKRAERTQAACMRMQRLVAALLFLARDTIDPGERCDVATIVGDVIPFYSSEINRKEISLDIDSRPTAVMAPPGIVDCIVHNLLDNAVEHAASGAVRITVKHRRLTVTDNGAGVSQDELAHIFERRYRSRESRGMGIGLYLVHRICTRLGWSITAGRADTGGARFEVAFDGSQTVSLQING